MIRFTHILSSRLPTVNIKFPFISSIIENDYRLWYN
ncbi:hypothetical protein VP501E541_P0008 [Vibrio phage 501E54-1]|nr:hypothetical protein VP501E541_P0008 [Vibrio phage 501E54-1]